MREEVKAFVESVARLLEPPGPVVEIGALQTPGQVGYADLRPLFSGREYLGVDLVAGPGVDRIEDVRALTFADGTVGTLLIVDCLEHVADPQHAVAEMYRVLKPDGVLLVGTPFIFPVHHHPDFTRFTPEGMTRLLSAFPDVAVFSVGDAQWPHSIVALAGKRGDAAAFAARVASVVRDWEASACPYGLLDFRPVESIIRRDDVYPTGVWLRPGEPYEHPFDFPAEGLCRLDVRLGADASIHQTGARFSLHPGDSAAPPVVEQFVPPQSLGDSRWIAFQFAPLPDSAGRRYVLRLSVDEGAVSTHTLRAGGLVFEAYRRRALVPPTPPPSATADAIAVGRLTAELQSLQQQVATLRAQLDDERATPWWRRLLGRRSSPA